MKNILVVCFVMIVSFSFTLKADDEKRSADFPLMVSAQWLEQHLNDPDLVVIHVGTKRVEYAKGHVPGSRFLWTGYIAMSNPDLSFQLLPVEQLKATLEELGVSNSSRIVLCGSPGIVSPVGRVYITFEYLGLGNRTAVLDGGMDAWKQDGKTISMETPKVKKTSFTPHLHPESFVDVDWMAEHIKKSGTTIIDARAPEFYHGTSKQYTRDGHIPGAKNIYFNTLFDTTNRFLPLNRIAEKFDSAGVGKNDEIAVYCHVGQTASSVFLAARYLGYKAHLYDGSYEEWNSRDDLPFEADPQSDADKK